MHTDKIMDLFTEGSIVTFIIKIEEKAEAFFVEVSDNIDVLTGFSSNELIEEKINFYSIIHPDDREFISGKINSVSGKTKEETIRVVHKNREDLWVRVKFANDGEGNISGYIINLNLTSDNISMLKTDCFFDPMYVEHSAIMILTDPATEQIIDINKSASVFYGYSREQMRTMKVTDIIKLPKHVLENEVESQLHWNKRYFISKHALASGDTKDVEVFSTPVMCGNKLLFFSIIRDISHRKIVEKKLEERTEQLQKLNVELSEKVREELDKRMQQQQLLIQQSKLASMGEMMGAIAHQWRQPLSSLSFIVQDIEDAIGYGEISKDYLTDSVKNAMEQINFMNKTVDSFRQFFIPSKQKQPFEARKAVFDVISLMSAQFNNYNIKATLELKCDQKQESFEDWPAEFVCEDKSELLINGYKNEFKQVLVNLLDNSKDAIVEKREKGGFSEGEQAFINVKIAFGEKNVIIQVEDNGIGVSEDLLEKIFVPYFTTKDDSHGTGIGLYMAKTIIESNMDGTLELGVTDGTTYFVINLKRYLKS